MPGNCRFYSASHGYSKSHGRIAVKPRSEDAGDRWTLDCDRRGVVSVIAALGFLAVLADSDFYNSPLGTGMWLGGLAIVAIFGVYVRVARGRRQSK